ncbi:hypothetical protein [Luteimonas sp. TWI1416]
MFALLMLCVLPATAQSLHKCREATGGIVYQSQACAGATLRTWEIADLRPPPVVAQPVQVTSNTPSARPRTVRARRLHAPRRSAATRDDRHARCIAARAHRDTTLARLGLKRRYDDLRRLNDAVSSACNHRGIR